MYGEEIPLAATKKAAAPPATAAAPAAASSASGSDAPGAAELVQWKSHIGVKLSSDRRLLRATAKGWGHSGALSDALLTRDGDVEGFVVTLPNAAVSLFIGVTNMATSLYAASRAHQEDLEHSLRVSSDGSLSYQSKARLLQYQYAPHLASEHLGEVAKGDAIGLRISPDRAGFSLFQVEAAAGADGKRHVRSLKYFSEVLAYPMKVLVVCGSSVTQIGPAQWLRTPKKETGGAGAAKPTMSLKASAEADTRDAGAKKVVKGRHAGDLLDSGTVDEDGNVLVLQSAGAGSWAAGKVRRVKPKVDESGGGDGGLYDAMLGGGSGGGGSGGGGSGSGGGAAAAAAMIVSQKQKAKAKSTLMQPGMRVSRQASHSIP